MKEAAFSKLKSVFYCNQCCKGIYLLFAASLLNYSFLSQNGLVLSEPAGQCDLLAFSMQKFFPRGKKDGHRKMHIRHIKVCQCVLQKGEKFTAGITVATFSLMVGRDYYPETVRHFL